MLKTLKTLVKKIMVLLLTLCLAAVAVGCGEIRLAVPLEDDVIIQINDEECLLSEAIFRLMEVKSDYSSEDDEMFWYRAIGDTTFEEYIKASVKSELEKATASVLIAEEKNITLTDTEKDEITQRATAAYEKIASQYDVESYDITIPIVANLYTKQAFYDKVFEKQSENLNYEISDTATKVIQINYVEIPSSVSVAQAEELRKEIEAGTSFETACRSFGLDPVLNAEMKMGDMPDDFEDVAYALTSGEISQVFDTGSCKYLIECVEDYLINESAANKNKVLSEARIAAFDEAYAEFAQTAIIRFNDKVWEKIVVSELK